MPRRKAGIAVDAFTHDAARRRNIPTAELQGLMAQAEAAPKKLRWPRNTDLDPQLVWRGKDEQGNVEVRVESNLSVDEGAPQGDRRRSQAAHGQVPRGIARTGGYFLHRWSTDIVGCVERSAW